LQALYSSHADYVARVKREADALVRQGFWLQSDAAQVVAQAGRAEVP
jgi:hypothetical protein